MSGITRGRIVRGDTRAVADAPRILRPGPSEAQRARLTREEVEAHANADRIIHVAISRSEAILAKARADAEEAAKEVSRRAAEDEQARLAAAWIALRDREERRTARDVERSIAFARVLAERLVGRAIELDPTVVASLAMEALAEARGARRVRLECHPLDAEALRTTLGLWPGGGGGNRDGGADGAALDLTENAELARGSLRVHTELGTLDATLHPRIERLAAALRDALGPA